MSSASVPQPQGLGAIPVRGVPSTEGAWHNSARATWRAVGNMSGTEGSFWTGKEILASMC